MTTGAVLCTVTCAYLCVVTGLTVPALWAREAGAGAGARARAVVPLRDIPQRCVEHSVTEVSCAGAGEDALLPHPDDCELFYYCVSGEQAPVCRQCPAGLHFSPATHVCATPDVAGCVLGSTTTVPEISAPPYTATL